MAEKKNVIKSKMNFCILVEANETVFFLFFCFIFFMERFYEHKNPKKQRALTTFWRYSG